VFKKACAFVLDIEDLFVNTPSSIMRLASNANAVFAVAVELIIAATIRPEINANTFIAI
jgi:hypothetical protein